MFIIIECVERQILAETCETREEAWEVMKKCLTHDINYGEFAKAYEEDKDENGFVTDADDYGITEDQAWANAAGGKLSCDWRIFDLDEI